MTRHTTTTIGDLTVFEIINKRKISLALWTMVCIMSSVGFEIFVKGNPKAL